MVSIIIPVLNEEKNIEQLLKAVKRLEGSFEIIVVDGGSSDNTAALAQRYCRVVRSKRGRSNQMNSGAEAADGDILWFVHADSKPDITSVDSIEAAVKSGCEGGGFSMYFYDNSSLFMKYISVTSNWRARYFKIYFGDQGIFVKKDFFFRLGAFPSIALMEDIELSRKLRKYKTTLLNKFIGTSARRFNEKGPLRTHLLMHWIRILYIFGTAPEKLEKIYRGRKKTIKDGEK